MAESTLFDTGEYTEYDLPQSTWRDWEGMPEYTSGDNKPAYRVTVCFKSHHDADQFFIEKQLGKKCSNIWWPDPSEFFGGNRRLEYRSIKEPPLPRFPIYIPSKSRAKTAKTPHVLEALGVPYRIVVEEQQVEDYAAVFPRDRLLVFDPIYRESFDPLMELEEGQSFGPGPARNFIWEHSIAAGYAFHWTMDDNIMGFERLHNNMRIPVGDGACFRIMENFVLRYQNIGMAGPQYHMFAIPREKRPPFVPGTRIYSCNLIRNDLPMRWRGRYNEDTILSLDILKAGWQTVQFNAFLQNKMVTQAMKGGNTEAFYAEEGTLPKSAMLRDAHPDVTSVIWRYGREHHYVNYNQWRDRPLVPRPGIQIGDSRRWAMEILPKGDDPDPEHVERAQELNQTLLGCQEP